MKRLKIDLKIGFESLNIMARDRVTASYLGNYKSIFKGKGLEFESYRNYTQDDDASLIDWKASARSDDLMIKQYIEERNLDVFFLLNTSDTMILSSQPKLKCEYAAEIIASLSYTILKSGDNIGYGLFSDKMNQFSPPAKKNSMFGELLDTLSNPENYGGGYNITAALNFCVEFLRRGTLLIIVSDFIGISKGWEELLKQAASKFSVIGIMVRDPIDRSIPEGMGQIAIEDPISGQRMIIDPNRIKPYYEIEAKKMENYVKEVFLENGADFTSLQTDSEFIGKMIELFKMREKRYR